jgi:hypothetical protein
MLLCFPISTRQRKYLRQVPLVEAVDHIDYGISAPIPKTRPTNGTKIVSTAETSARFFFRECVDAVLEIAALNRDIGCVANRRDQRKMISGA